MWRMARVYILNSYKTVWRALANTVLEWIILFCTKDSVYIALCSWSVGFITLCIYTSSKVWQVECVLTSNGLPTKKINGNRLFVPSACFRYLKYRHLMCCLFGRVGKFSTKLKREGRLQWRSGIWQRVNIYEYWTCHEFTLIRANGENNYIFDRFLSCGASL